MSEMRPQKITESWARGARDRVWSHNTSQASFGLLLVTSLVARSRLVVGRGLPVEFEMAELARCVRVDPSSAMLNALAPTNMGVADVHPRTFFEAVQRRVLGGTDFDTVVAIGGSASHATVDDIK